jgi:hypothetical protein
MWAVSDRIKINNLFYIIIYYEIHVFIGLDRSGFVGIVDFGKIIFISVSPRFVASTAMASGFIALVPFL